MIALLSYVSADVDVKASQIEKLFQRGKFTGDCLVSLRNEKEVDEAIKKHRKHIGSRYVEGKFIWAFVKLLTEI